MLIRGAHAIGEKTESKNHHVDLDLTKKIAETATVGHTLGADEIQEADETQEAMIAPILRIDGGVASEMNVGNVATVAAEVYIDDVATVATVGIVIEAAATRIKLVIRLRRYM